LFTVHLMGILGVPTIPPRPDAVEHGVAQLGWRGSSTVSASANKSAGALLVDVGPALFGGALWEVIVQRLSDSGGGSL
jgi:hypothetical protein